MAKSPLLYFAMRVSVSYFVTTELVSVLYEASARKLVVLDAFGCKYPFNPFEAHVQRYCRTINALPSWC